jgi:hypothetical protein
MAEWISSASVNELAALFENPSLGDSFLTDLLERRDGLESIDDERLLRIVRILSSNPRMWTPRDDDYMDGFADYSYSAVFNAAWKLAQTVPANKSWAAALASLYSRLEPDAFSVKEPLVVATRWHAVPADIEAVESGARSRARGYLSDMESVRSGLARLALSRDSKLLDELVTSHDVAFRVAAYSAGRLSLEQVLSGFEKDGEMFFNAAIDNLNLWKNPATRGFFRGAAWRVVDMNNSDLMAVNIYKWKAKDVRKKHPAWFADEERGEDVVDALSAIVPHRTLVTAQEFLEAGKLIILAFLLQDGREDIAQATSEGARMIRRAKAAVDGQMSVSTLNSNADALAMFGLLRQEVFLRSLKNGGAV